MLLAFQDSYFKHLIALGLLLEETGIPEKSNGYLQKRYSNK